MKLKQLLDEANKGYPDQFLSGFYDDEGKLITERVLGDGLARFVVTEISETFDAEATDEAQLHEARRVIEQAIIDLNGVRLALLYA
jgi:hypothetical protein